MLQPAAQRTTLPLKKAALSGKTVCMFGPNAGGSGKAMMGGYVPHPKSISTPFEGLVAALPASTVKLVPGCNTTKCASYDKAAVAEVLSSGCDVSIAVMGLTAYANPGSHLPPMTQEPGNACGCVVGDGVEGECCDRQDVALPGAQLQMLQQIAAASLLQHKPCILVSINAGMVDLSWPKTAASVGAIINAPYLGQTAGAALAATLLGANNPAGELQITACLARTMHDTLPVPAESRCVYLCCSERLLLSTHPSSRCLCAADACRSIAHHVVHITVAH